MTNKLLRLKEIVQSYVANEQFMGAVLVAKNGHLLINEGYGFANLEWEIPNSSITKFRLGSLTKQFTAAAILLLEERGQLNITGSINKYLPDMPTAWNDITIFHLLTHTSGIPNYTRFPEFSSITTLTKKPEQQIDLFRNKPLVFQPGSNYEYCNSGYVLLGYLIEKITGLSFKDFIVNHLFKPLGMDDSGYDSHSDIILHRASGYEIKSDGLHNADFLEMSLPYAAGSLYSTTHDLLIWQEALFAGKFISSTSVNKMIQPFKNSYGLGVSIQSFDGHKAITHGGGINGFNTFMIYFPEEKITIIILANLIAFGFVPQSLGLNLARVIYKKPVVLPFERKEITFSTKVLNKYTGSYTIKPVNVYYTTQPSNLLITLLDDHLVAKIEVQPEIKLFPESETIFFSRRPDIKVEFLENEKDQSIQIAWMQDGDRFIGKKNNEEI